MRVQIDLDAVDYTHRPHNRSPARRLEAERSTMAHKQEKEKAEWARRQEKAKAELAAAKNDAEAELASIVMQIGTEKASLAALKAEAAAAEKQLAEVNTELDRIRKRFS